MKKTVTNSEYFDDAAARQAAAAAKNDQAAVRMDADGLPQLARIHRRTAAQHRAAAAKIERMAREGRAKKAVHQGGTHG